MTNQGPRRAVEHGYWTGRLMAAREFQFSATSLIELEGTSSYNGAVTLIINAAIAYADALTAKRKGVVNKQDHQTAPRLLREVCGNELPDKHEKFFKKLLARKDEVSYGARSTPLDEARRLLQELADFGAWAEGEL